MNPIHLIETILMTKITISEAIKDFLWCRTKFTPLAYALSIRRKKLLKALFIPYVIPDPSELSLSILRKEDESTGTRAIATIREQVSEKIMVHARLSNICPMIPSLLLNKSIGRKIQMDVSVLEVIEEIISCEPRMAATVSFASLCL